MKMKYSQEKNLLKIYLKKYENCRKLGKIRKNPIDKKIYIGNKKRRNIGNKIPDTSGLFLKLQRLKMKNQLFLNLKQN